MEPGTLFSPLSHLFYAHAASAFSDCYILVFAHRYPSDYKVYSLSNSLTILSLASIQKCMVSIGHGNNSLGSCSCSSLSSSLTSTLCSGAFPAWFGSVREPRYSEKKFAKFVQGVREGKENLEPGGGVKKWIKNGNG
jgi:hypothetical protein